MRLHSLFLILILVSCSQVKKRTVIVPEGEAAWIYAASEGCSDDEICASGEGDSFTSSDAHAKKAIAGIFETQVKSEFQFSKESFSGDEKKQMQEYVEDSVNQHVDYLLKGSYIKERFKKDGLMFSLAALDKNKASSLISQELEKTDDQISQIFSKRSRIFIKKLTILYNQRELLNEKLILITGKSSPRRVEISQINELKYMAKGQRKIRLIVSDKTPRVLKKKFEEYCTSIGYKLINKKDYDWLINLDYKSKEEYLNVRGFKKFTFSVSLEAKNSQAKKIGTYLVTQVSNGRNEMDAFLKVREKVLKEIEDNIDKLNLK